jgi:WD40 repeat protein
VRVAREIAFLSGHARDVFSAAFSPDGSRIVTASWDWTARIWDAASAKEKSAQPPGCGLWVLVLADRGDSANW